eukprot:10362143-Alexandrium_andersonii.AAC.1
MELGVVRKRTTLGRVRAPLLERTGCTCQGHHAHLALNGGSAAPFAKYDAAVCKQWARHTREAYDEEKPQLAVQDQLDEADKGRPRLERLLVNEAVSRADWEVVLQTQVSRPQHINILEVRAAVRALARRAEQEPGTRQ